MGHSQNIANNEKLIHCGFVALMGRPNVGKSSLINAMIKEKVAAVSPKPQTTRNAVRCIFSNADMQIVFVDTPGMHTPRHMLGEFMLKEINDALMCVDAVCFVVEAGDRTVGAKERQIVDILSHINLPVVMALNKTDLLSKPELCKKTVQIYTDALNPEALIPVSAKNGKNLDLLVAEIAKVLPLQQSIYPQDMLMDATEKFLAAEVIREQIFLLTEEEVPHSVAVIIDEYKTPDEYPKLKTARISATIIVDRAGQKGIIIGKGGSKLKEIGSAARQELELRTGCPVFLQLWVKVKTNWRKSEDELRRLGYSF